MATKKQSKFPISRIIGLILIAWAIYMYANDIEYKSTYEAYRGVYKEQQSISISYIKMGIVGLVFFFFREILRYLDWVKYS